MIFIWNLAWRELRASWRRLLLFFVCIGIGTGSIVALRSLIGNSNAAVAGEARTLLGGDVVVDSTRALSDQTRAEIETVIARAPGIAARTEMLDAPTMARPAATGNDTATLVELRGVGSPYPLVGDFVLEGGKAFDASLLADNGAVVGRALLERLGVRLGERIRVGDAEFEIRGVIEREPAGGGGGFRIGPRVIVTREGVEAAGLTGFGTRARRRILVRLERSDAGAADALAKNFRDAITDNLISVRSYRNAEQSLTDQFRRAEDFLSLTGLIILVLGGLGVANVLRVFIEGKRRAIAILKCVGATGNQVTLAYLAQTVLLGAAGAACGVLLAWLALLYVGATFRESLPQNMTFGLRPEAVAQGLVAGVLVTVLFALLPLLRIRFIKPRLLLRDEFAQAREESAARGIAGGSFASRVRGWMSRIDPVRAIVACVVAVGLTGVAAWQANSVRVGAVFLVSLAVTAGALYAVASALVTLLRRVRALDSFTLRQAITSLHRPGNQTRVTVTAIGLGVFLILGIQSLQQNLLREFTLAPGERLPDMFLTDVQPDQAESVRQVVAETVGARPDLVPTVRMRIAAVDGRAIEIDSDEVRRERGMLGREYIVTYRPRLESNERIIDGAFWQPTPTGEPEISIEEGLRGTGGIDLGSRVTFDVLGRRITARVTSVREVDWASGRTGFLVVFRPGALESAPQTYVGAINGPADDAARARFQRRIVEAHPNVSVIDVLDIVRTIGRIVDNITLAVSFLGGFVLLSGILILAGSIAMTKFQRVYETGVLRTLGARGRTLLVVLFLEYGLMGLVAGITGSLAAVGLSYGVTRYVFDLRWTPSPLINLVGILATVLLVVAIGAAANSDVLRRKPLAVLRGA